MNVVFLPVRHHSPACAVQVRRLLEQVRPAEVLIEGPADFNAHFGRLQERDVVPPVALFTYVARPSVDDPGQTERFQGWYPFCDYTPEWVALKTAARLGILASFIDLPLAERVALELDPETRELLKDGGIDLFARSDEAVERYIAHLGAKIRSRDSDDTWDRLFEIGANMAPVAFFENLRAFGGALRAMTGEQVAAARGDVWRERFMAARILEAVERNEAGATIAVVCGAFHVEGLERLLAGAPIAVSPGACPVAEERGIYLVPYDFKRMSSLHYAAGVAAPAWYQGLWEDLNTPAQAGPFWMRMLAEAMRAAREADIALSTAELEAASEMALRLATFRNQAEPSRVDVLDAVRTCWVKGPVDQAHARVLGVVDAVFRGDRAGQAGSSASDPPLVQDVDRLLLAASLDCAKGKRELRLRPARAERDRDRMRLLLRLQYLGVAYATQLRGQHSKRREREAVDQPTLHNCSMRSRSLPSKKRGPYGATLEDAVAERLRELAGRAEGGAASAVGHLFDACALGLHRLADILLEKLAPAIAGEGRLLSVLKAVQGLVTLYRYRDVLEGVGLPALAEAIGRCWQRALWLIDTLASVSEEEEDEALQGLRALEHVALTLGEERDDSRFGVEADAYFDALSRVRPALRHLPGLHGGAGGLLWRAGQCDADELSEHATAHFREVGLFAEAPGRFVGGLLTVARRAVLDEPLIILGLGEALGELDEQDFRRSLPRLRRAMAALTPSETGQLARQVVALWGGDALELVGRLDLPVEELVALRVLEAEVRQDLGEWG
nr:hypothetical protein [Lujinxingiaceae bacterium]